MRRLRIAILGNSPCDRCHAACCVQNGHEFSVLLEEHERRRFAAFAIDVTVEVEGVRRIEKVLPYRDGRCIFLGPDDRCLIYEDRPESCRRFECAKAFHHGGADVSSHGLFLQRNPGVLKLLEEW